MNILLNKGRNPSSAFALNYLAQSDKFYIMDNHLAAFWCWNKELDPKDDYTLFHFDRHNDLSTTLVKEAFHLFKNKEFRSMGINETTSLNIGESQMVSWNNFIELYNVFNPYTFNYFHFITPVQLPVKYGGKKNIPLKTWVKKEWTTPEWYELQYGGIQYVVDIDIDVFFRKTARGYRPVLLKDELAMFVSKLKPLIESAQIVTIALSPECCGGWDSSIEMFNILNDQLGIIEDELLIP